MKLTYKHFLLALCFLALGCNPDDTSTSELELNDFLISGDVKILSLGDSFTIGEGVCNTCKYPEILKQKIKLQVQENNQVMLNIIAKTGWTTSDLIAELNTNEIETNHDLVTLLIGVNNQYQNGTFSLYEKDLPELIEKAIKYASGNKNNVIVISIPDYAYTPFGQNWASDPQTISDDLDLYNGFAQNYCLNNDIAFVNITDISRQGLENVSLVASDDLHPSYLAHLKFVERILPIAIQKLNN